MTPRPRGPIVVGLAAALLTVVAVGVAVVTQAPVAISQWEAERIARKQFQIYLAIRKLNRQNFEKMQLNENEMGWSFEWKSNDRIGSFGVFVDKKGDHWVGSDVAR